MIKGLSAPFTPPWMISTADVVLIKALDPKLESRYLRRSSDEPGLRIAFRRFPGTSGAYSARQVKPFIYGFFWSM